MSRFIFAFSLPSEVELTLWRSKRIPSTRLWSLVELGDLNESVSLCRRPTNILSKFGVYGWRVWQTAWLLRSTAAKDIIIGVHEISVLLLLLLRRLGIRRGSVVLVNLGLLHPKNQSGLRLRVWTVLLRHVEAVVSLVESQNDQLQSIFGVGQERLHFIPMHVDSSFYDPVAVEEEERFCLAVGTNDGKDFETLLSALPLGERLVIVTDRYNAIKIRSHRCFGAMVEVYENVPALDLRNLYRRAAVLVIPLSDTPHGSGHTVLLEGMALGKLIVASATRSMVGYVEDGKNALLVTPGDVEALRLTLVAVLTKPQKFRELRSRAVSDARNRFDVHLFARALRKVAFGKDLPDQSIGSQLGVGGNVLKLKEVEHASLS